MFRGEWIRRGQNQKDDLVAAQMGDFDNQQFQD